jgi:hypothetical protein
LSLLEARAAPEIYAAAYRTRLFVASAFD